MRNELSVVKSYKYVCSIYIFKLFYCIRWIFFVSLVMMYGLNTQYFSFFFSFLFGFIGYLSIAELLFLCQRICVPKNVGTKKSNIKIVSNMEIVCVGCIDCYYLYAHYIQSLGMICAFERKNSNWCFVDGFTYEMKTNSLHTLYMQKTKLFFMLPFRIGSRWRRKSGRTGWQNQIQCSKKIRKQSKKYIAIY